HWQNTPRWWRALAAYLLVDPTVAVGVAGYEQAEDPERGHRHYLGGAALLWVAWLCSVAVGALASCGLPAALHLEFVIPLFLVGEAAARVSTREARRAVGVAVAIAVLGTAAPLQLGTLVAVLAGIAAGLRAGSSRR